MAFLCHALSQNRKILKPPPPEKLYHHHHHHLHHTTTHPLLHFRPRTRFTEAMTQSNLSLVEKISETIRNTHANPKLNQTHRHACNSKKPKERPVDYCSRKKRSLKERRKHDILDVVPFDWMLFRTNETIRNGAKKIWQPLRKASKRKLHPPPQFPVGYAVNSKDRLRSILSREETEIKIRKAQIKPHSIISVRTDLK